MRWWFFRRQTPVEMPEMWLYFRETWLLYRVPEGIGARKMTGLEVLSVTQEGPTGHLGEIYRRSQVALRRRLPVKIPSRFVLRALTWKKERSLNREFLY